MTAKARDVLVVIPCLNEERTIASVLDELLADASADRMRIVVADGGSQDLSRAIVRRFESDYPGQVTLLPNPGRYQSVAVNAAMRRFGEGVDWLVRVDAHCVYPKDYVTRLIAAAAETSADSVVVPLKTAGRTCLQRGIAAAQNSRFGTGGAAHRHPGRSLWVEHGHHALFRTSRFVAVGGYDEAYTHNEDAELDHRLVSSGARIWLQGDLALTYIPRQSLGSLFKQYFAYGRGRARTVMRHNVRLRPRQALPLLVPVALAMALAGPWIPALAAPAAIWLGACVLVGAGLGVHQRSFCVMSSAAAFAVMHLAWGLGFLRQATSRAGEPDAPRPLAAGANDGAASAAG